MSSIKPSAGVRGTLKRVPGLKSVYYLSMALRQMAADQWKRPVSFDEIFSAQPDPWSSDSEAEKLRFDMTLSVLAFSGRTRFASAVEIGCAEGVFTERLAPMCDELLALDFSAVALERARVRLAAASNVRFREWDLRTDRIPGRFELAVAIGVLTCLYRPGDVRKAASMVIAAVEPGGFLLFSDVRQSQVFETAWWGRLVLRGGEQIRRLLSRNPALATVAVADTPTHVFALYRRRAA